MCGVSCVLFQNFDTNWNSSSYLFHSHLIDSDSFKHSPWIVYPKIYSNHLRVFDVRYLCRTTCHIDSKLFTIVIWFCWTIYTLLCLISFCASVHCTSVHVHTANGTCNDTTVFKHTCCQTSSYRFQSFLLIWGIYTCAPLKHHVN